MSFTTINDPSAHFHTQLYIGNKNSANAITNDANAGDFQPDWLWIKSRDTAGGSGVNFVEFDNSYGTFNISARAVNSGHALIGNILTDSITLVEPTGTIGIPNITDLSFTVDITDINKDYIIVDLLDYA